MVDIYNDNNDLGPLIQSEMTIVNESGEGDENDTLSTTLVSKQSFSQCFRTLDILQYVTRCYHLRYYS